MSRFYLIFAILCGSFSPIQAQQSAEEREWKSAVAALQAEKFDIAVERFNRVLPAMQRADPPFDAETIAETFRLRADAHYGAEHWNLAVADYSKCIALDPKNADAYAFRGVARKASGDYDGLMADSKKAAQLNPEHEYLIEAAESTILRRRAFTALFVVGALICVAGLLPFAKAIMRVAKAEKNG